MIRREGREEKDTKKGTLKTKVSENQGKFLQYGKCCLSGQKKFVISMEYSNDEKFFLFLVVFYSSYYKLTLLSKTKPLSTPTSSCSSC